MVRLIDFKRKDGVISTCGKGEMWKVKWRVWNEQCATVSGDKQNVRMTIDR